MLIPDCECITCIIAISIPGRSYTLFPSTQGRCVFASGSPFNAVTLGDETFHPGQGNNAYIFPGVALGVICCGVRHIEEAVFLESAQVGEMPGLKLLANR